MLKLRNILYALVSALALLFIAHGLDLGLKFQTADNYTLEVELRSNVNAQWTTEFVYKGNAFEQVGKKRKKFVNMGSTTVDFEGNGEYQILSFPVPVDNTLSWLRFQVKSELSKKRQGDGTENYVHIKAFRLMNRGSAELDWTGKDLKANLGTNRGLIRQETDGELMELYYKKPKGTVNLKSDLSEVVGFRDVKVQEVSSWFYPSLFVFSFLLMWIVFWRLPFPKWRELYLFDFALGLTFLCAMLFSNLQLKYPLVELPNTEKREMFSLPEFKLFQSHEYLKQVSTYFQENFGFRNHLIRANSFIKYMLLKVSPIPDRAVVGKEQWLFHSGITRDMNAMLPLREGMLDSICEVVQKTHAFYSQRGIAYYVFFPTEKGIVYPEMLPWGFNANNSLRRQVVAAIRSRTNVPVIDVEETLLREKSEHMLYYKYDFHWNDVAAFFAYRDLMNVISKDFPSMKPIEWDKLEIEETRSQQMGLLYTMAMHEQLFEDTKYIKPIEGSNMIFTKDPVYPKRTKLTDQKKPELPNAIVVHDSFFKPIMKLFSPHFNRVVYVQNETKEGNQKVERKFIRRENPVIILHEYMIFSENDLRTLLGH